MALVYIRPDADTDDGDWVNASGNNTNLYDSVNESVASDSDYIRSGNNPVNDIVKLRLGDFASVPAEPMTVRYRFKKVVSAGEVLSLKVRLVEGDAPGTTIAEWEHDGVSDTYTDGEQELTSGQFALVSDFDDLYLEFEAISGALEVIEPGPLDGSYLLIDEDEGFAINAMYPGDLGDAAYVGAPIGGSVAVIDTGTPANDLDDVPLDSSNLTQAGTSAKLVHWHEAPYVRWTPHNLALQSQTFNSWTTNNASVSADSTTAPDGTSTADTVTASAGSNTHFIYYNSLSGLAGVQYTLSVYAKTNTTQYFQLSMASASGSDWLAVVADLNGGIITQATAGAAATLIGSGITSVGNGWYRITVTGIINTSTRYPVVEIVNSGTPTQSVGGDVTWNPAGTESVYVWGYQINRGPIALPYLVTTSAARIGIPQSYDINEDMFGVLVEPAATNICLQSEEFDTTWTTGSSGVDDQFIEAPDGSTTADAISSGGGTAYIIQGGLTYTAAAWTASCYFKAGTVSWVELQLSNGTGKYAAKFFDLANGVVGSSNAATWTVSGSTITAVGNGWYRCTVTSTLDTSGGSDGKLLIVVCDGDGDETTSSTNSIYAWGAQVELGSVATSYIPTLGSTVTRAADQVSVDIGTFPCDLTQGIFIGMGKINDASAGYNTLIGSNIGGNEFIRMQSDDTNLAEIVEGSDDATATTGTGNWDTAARKAATAYTASGLAAAFEGGAINTESFSPDYSGVTYIHIGSRGGATLHWNGYIYQVTYLPRARVNDAELIAMSEGL